MGDPRRIRVGFFARDLQVVPPHDEGVAEPKTERLAADDGLQAEDPNEPEDETAAALITAILLEHFGDGLPVHADVVMDTVQYRLARDVDEDDCRKLRDGCYFVWADRRASRAYRQCLARLVRSGRIRVVYDCGCGCGACLEDGGGARCAGGTMV